MTKLELVNSISKRTGMDARDVLLILEEVMSDIKKQLSNGENVYLRGFGSFVVKKRAKKTARNIKRNTRVEVPAHYTPVFKPAIFFKEAVKKLPVDE